MREVCHRKSTTSCQAFIKTKLAWAQVTTAAISYEKLHENQAILLYVYFLKKKPTNCCWSIQVRFDNRFNWFLAYSKSRWNSFGHHRAGVQKRCLEVKCPYVWKDDNYWCLPVIVWLRMKAWCVYLIRETLTLYFLAVQSVNNHWQFLDTWMLVVVWPQLTTQTVRQPQNILIDAPTQTSLHYLVFEWLVKMVGCFMLCF